MSWTVSEIGRFADFKHGFAFKSEFFTDHGPFVILTPGNCHEKGGFRSKGDKEKYYSGDVPDGYLLSQGELVVVMTDLVSTAPVLGGAFFVPEENRFLHNQRLGLVKITRSDLIDKDFLYYLLNTHNYRAQVRGAASGATVRHTSPGRIKNCKVRYPQDRKIQRKIVETLSAYDDLIENNRRRMALLEEAARLLYREWFVHFRFPGHEHVKITDGPPEKWERRTLGDLMTLKRGYDLPEARRMPGEIPVVSSSGITGYHNSHRVRGPGIVTGRYGTIGAVFLIHDDFWPLNTSLYIQDMKGNSLSYLLYMLRHALPSVQSDKAAVPGLNRNTLHTISVSVPPPLLIDQFDEFAVENLRQIKLLSDANEKLAQARDLLLPRLMNGEIAA